MGGLSFFPNNELVVHLKHLCDVYIYRFFEEMCQRISRRYPWQHDNYCIFSFVYVITVI